MNITFDNFRIAILAGTIIVAAHSSSVFACASCGCSLSTDAAMGYTSQPGWRVNLQYDYLNQDELRIGSGTASPEQVINVPTTGELERETINRYITTTVSYLPSPSWGLALQVPYLIRSHSTYGELEPPFDAAAVNAANLSASHSSSLGDIKFIGSYQGFLPTHTLGVQLGVKLPTGSYGSHVRFSSGPMAGEALDTSLQPGTGSTDLIIGAYDYQALSRNWDGFVSGQYQAPIAHKLDQPGNDFRPGNQTALSFGVRYAAHPRWVPQLQVNVLHKSADRGALADVADSAGTLAYLSPGLSVNVQKKLQIYGFVQVPVYYQLDGYQLAPRWSSSVGVSYGF